MGLFVCTECRVIENTALSNWAIRKAERKPVLCSQCDPDIGVWHGQFPRELYTEKWLSEVFNPPECWYCREKAVEIWHTSWDEPGQDWPMCATCLGQVRQSLAHRAEGRHTEADAIDEQSGISTDRNCGQWIPPATANTQ